MIGHAGPRGQFPLRSAGYMVEFQTETGAERVLCRGGVMTTLGQFTDRYHVSVAWACPGMRNVRMLATVIHRVCRLGG